MVDEKNKAAIKIQAHYRGHKERKSFKRKRYERDEHRKNYREIKCFDERTNFVYREAKEKEKAEMALKEEEEQTLEPNPSNSEEISSTPDGEAGNEEETKAAVVLQSNYRGYKERKKFKERKNAGAEEQPNTAAEEESRHEATSQDEGGKTADSQGNYDEDEESTFKAEENDDSDHTQVPEDDEHTEVVAEAGTGEAAATDAGKEEQVEDKNEENAAVEEVVNLEETKAATVIQSNFRGHKERKRLQEEGKIPARKVKSPTGEENMPEVQEEKTEERAKELTEEADVSSGDFKADDPDEAKAAVVIQSNFRGHKERKRLQEEGKIPRKKKKEEEVQTEPSKTKEQITEPEKAAENVENPEGLDEEKAATVLQSNFRGQRDRKKLKAEREAQKTAAAIPDAREEEQAEVEAEEEAVDVADVMIEHKEETDAEKQRLEEEQAAVKIQSNFRGYKDRKNLKANQHTAQKEAEDLQSFSKEVKSFDVIMIQLSCHWVCKDPGRVIQRSDVFSLLPLTQHIVSVSTTDHKSLSGLCCPAAQVE